MADEKERVDWAALMDAHGIDPDADTRGPAVEPVRRVEPEPEGGRKSRLVYAFVVVTALFSIAASVAVLVVMVRGGDGGEKESAPAAEPVATGPRPAAFQQTSDGVTVVPPEAAVPPPPVAQPKPTAPPAEPADAPSAVPKAEPAAKPHAPPPAARPRPVAEKPAAEPASEKASKDGKAAKDEKAEPAAPAEPPDPNLPDEPDKDAVASAMEKLEKDIAACAAPAKVSGQVSIKMHIDPDGSVAWASAKVQNSPFQACLDRLFKKARMPKSQKGATVRQTVDLP